MPDYIIRQRDRGQAKAKCLRPRPKLRGRGRGQNFGLRTQENVNYRGLDDGVAGQFDDVMGWVRALYSRRQLVFSLVETSNNDNDVISATTDDSAPLNSAVAGSSNRQPSRRRNASLKVCVILTYLV